MASLKFFTEIGLKHLLGILKILLSIPRNCNSNLIFKFTLPKHSELDLDWYVEKIGCCYTFYDDINILLILPTAVRLHSCSMKDGFNGKRSFPNFREINNAIIEFRSN